MILSIAHQNYVKILFALGFLNGFKADLKAGDSCTLSSGDEGLCKYLNNCEPALKILDEGGFPEDKCSSEGTKFIVCCEDTSPVRSTTSTTTPQPRQEIPSPEIATSVTVTDRRPGEISKQKCMEYAKYVWERHNSPAVSVTRRVTNTFECPFEKVPLIVGGTFAARREFPHMVLIGYNKRQTFEWNCGGTLISENYVLTASHCLRHSNLGLAKLVRLGMTNRSDIINMQEVTISEVRYHPDYHSSSKYNDIALIKLSKNVRLNTFARPACLQTEKEIRYKKAIATGWGDIGYAKESSESLLKVVLEFFDHPTCNETYKKKIKRADTGIPRGIVDDVMLCAGSHKENEDTCYGDSGGPLQVYYNDSEVACMYSIVGVTSFGDVCGLGKRPGVYARVSQYIKWIEDVVWPE